MTYDQLPAEEKASCYFLSMEYNLARDEHARILNPYQSAYLLLDNGRGNEEECVLSFRSQFDQFLSDISTLDNGM